MTKTADVALSPEVMKAIAALMKQPAKRAKPTAEETEARRATNDAECIKVFKAAGYDDVRPRENVLTYGKVKPDGTVTGWLAKGRKVKAGEKAHTVGPFRLFHELQTEIIPVEGVVH